MRIPYSLTSSSSRSISSSSRSNGVRARSASRTARASSHRWQPGRVTTGDREAFDELYRRYAKAAYGLAYRLTGQQILAQDVVHDAYMALWRAPEAYDPARGAFRTFFLSLVHHRAVDTVRREERLRKRQERASNLEPVADEDVAEGVVDEAWVAIRRREVRQALTTLPPEQRQVLEMAYFDGKTQVAIADELQIPIGTVKTRTLAAMRKLRRALDQEDGV
jgi:RNA polymerase sigma factor (sigma-70 family)